MWESSNKQKTDIAVSASMSHHPPSMFIHLFIYHPLHYFCGTIIWSNISTRGGEWVSEWVPQVLSRSVTVMNGKRGGGWWWVIGGYFIRKQKLSILFTQKSISNIHRKCELNFNWICIICRYTNIHERYIYYLSVQVHSWAPLSCISGSWRSVRERRDLESFCLFLYPFFAIVF